MKALIVGAGRIGRAAGYDLRKHGVQVTYYDKDCSKTAADVLDSDEFGPGNVNSAEEEIRRVKYDVVLGCAGYDSNLELTQACIDVGSHFCDLGGNNDVVRKQLKLNDAAEKVGVVVIPDCGLAPGLACMLAAFGIESVGGTADRVDIYVGGLPQNPEPPLNYALSWSVTGLINEYREPSLIIKNGRIQLVESMSGSVPFYYDNDKTEYEAFYTSGGLSTLAETYLGKVNNLSYKTIRYNNHIKFFKIANEFGLFDDPVRWYFENALERLPKISKDNPDKVLVSIDVLKDNIYFNARFVDKFDIVTNMSAMARTTGFSIAAIAHMLGSGIVKEHINNKYDKSGGVIPGELSLPLLKYIDEIQNRGIGITISGKNV
jgi:lysine 6-dehydrogenase